MKNWSKGVFKKKGKSGADSKPTLSSISNARINCSIVIEGEKYSWKMPASFPRSIQALFTVSQYERSFYQSILNDTLSFIFATHTVSVKMNI